MKYTRMDKSEWMDKIQRMHDIQLDGQQMDGWIIDGESIDGYIGDGWISKDGQMDEIFMIDDIQVDGWNRDGCFWTMWVNCLGKLSYFPLPQLTFPYF